MTDQRMSVKCGITRVGDLEVDFDLGQQEREWRFERIIWALGALILLAAAFGLLGHGPYSETKAGDERSGLWARYNWVTRYQSPELISVHAKPLGGREVSVSFTQAFVEHIDLDSIMPEPVRVELDGSRYNFVFATGASGDPSTVYFHYRPDRYGPLMTDVEASSGDRISIRQFVLP